MEPIVIPLVGLAAYKAYRYWRKPKAKPKKQLKGQYRESETWPIDTLETDAQWGKYKGARPELRGAPENTILALPSIERLTPEGRAALLDVAERVQIPVDSLATILAKESGFNTKAAYMVDVIDKVTGKPTGQRKVFAAGLGQITVGAHLPGFGSTERLAEVLEWDDVRQILDIIGPYFARFGVKTPRAMTPGAVYMLNFLPDDARKPDDFALGDKRPGASDWRKKVYSMNAHFDPVGKGYYTVADVKATTVSIISRAKGRRITVDGRIIARPAPDKRVRAKGQGGPYRESYKADDLAGGILLACIRAGKYVEPTWVPVKMPDGLEVMVTEDAIQGIITVEWPSEDAEKLLAQMPKEIREALTPAERAGLSLPTTGPWYLPVSYKEQIEIARHFGAVSPTQEIWDAAWKQAKWQQRPNPEFVKGKDGMPDGTLRQSNLFAQTLGSRTGGLVRDQGKGWILHRRLSETGAVNYGWIDPKTKKPLQSVGAKHGPEHYDYSQTCVLAKRYAQLKGERVDLLEYFKLQGIESRFLDVYR